MKPFYVTQLGLNVASPKFSVEWQAGDARGQTITYLPVHVLAMSNAEDLDPIAVRTSAFACSVQPIFFGHEASDAIRSSLRAVAFGPCARNRRWSSRALPGLAHAG
jgi:hypothetical protein